LQHQTTLFSSLNSSTSYTDEQIFGSEQPQFRQHNLNVILNTQSLKQNAESPPKSNSKHQRKTKGMKENAGNEFAGLQQFIMSNIDSPGEQSVQDFSSFSNSSDSSNYSNDDV
jgi:hypothetical protein